MMKWGCKRAFIRCGLLFTAGAALQFICGNADPSWLRYPLGLILAVNYIYIMVLLSAKSDKWKWVRQLSDHHASVSSLACMLVMTLVFGLTHQDGSTSGLAGALGFRAMSTSWPFCLMLLYFITVLGMRAIEEVRHWRRHPLMTTAIHCSVFVVLAAAFFGSGDKEKIRIVTHVGEPVHAGISPQTGQKAALPFFVTLEEFVMETYPDGEPKMYLSRIIISDNKGDQNHQVQVNHPARKGCWKIYQTGYDRKAGCSTLECVKDGWYPMVKTGLWIILAAGVFMALTAGYRSKKEDKR